MYRVSSSIKYLGTTKVSHLKSKGYSTHFTPPPSLYLLSTSFLFWLFTLSPLSPMHASRDNTALIFYSILYSISLLFRLYSRTYVPKDRAHLILGMFSREYVKSETTVKIILIRCANLHGHSSKEELLLLGVSLWYYVSLFFCLFWYFRIKFRYKLSLELLMFWSFKNFEV